MQTSIFLARLLSPAFLVMAIAMTAQPGSFRSILQEFTAGRGLIWLTGLLALIAGLALVLTHNVWVADWRVLITLVGWIVLVKAAALIFLPQRMANLGSWFLAHLGAFRASAALMFVIGTVLSYFGYLA